MTRNEVLAALSAEDSFVLAVVLVDGGFVHQPLYVPNPVRIFGPEPGFAEVSRAISVIAIGESVETRP